MSIKPANVDQYIDSGCGRCDFGATPRCKVRSWQAELHLLREILRETGLREEVKWNAPCYTHDGKNVLMLSALRESVTVSFFRGGELKDTAQLLEKPGDNSRFVRYLRFTDTGSIAARKSLILDYAREATTLETSGRQKRASDPVQLTRPEELERAFAEHPALEDAFAALTPGRQRGYLLHFTSAKQSATRSARIEKCIPRILEGKGWNER